MACSLHCVRNWGGRNLAASHCTSSAPVLARQTHSPNVLSFSHTVNELSSRRAFLVSNEGRLKMLPVRISCLAVPDTVFRPANFLPLLKSLLMFYRSLSAFVLRVVKLRLVRDYFRPYTRRDQPPIFFLTSLEFLLYWSSG